MADFLEQENQLLKEEITTMHAKMDEMAAMQAQVDELTELVRTLKAAHNQPPPPVSTQAEASPSTIFDGTTPFSTRPTTCRPLVPTFQPTARTPPSADAPPK